MILQRVYGLSFLLLAVAVIGCGGGGDPGQKPTFSATGKLSVDDKPFGPANLTFSNTSTEPTAPSMSGKADKDGAITFNTYGHDGVVAAGTYNVQMSGDVMGMFKVPASEIGTVEVKSGDKNVDVKLKALAGGGEVGGLALPPPPNK